MKIQNIFLLASLLIIQLVSARYIKKPNHNGAKTEKIFNYNFHCVKDNKNMCSKLQKKVKKATDLFSTILDETSKVNFEVFVDNLSRYRIDKSKEVLAVAMDTNFNHMNPKNDNIISPYPNSKTIQKLLKNKKNVDFILLLNSFKSDKTYLDDLQDEKTLILLEIYEALYTLGGKLLYPYNEKKGEIVDLGTSFQMASMILNLRKNETFINEYTLSNENKLKEYSDANKFYDVIQWEDTLISKDHKISSKLKNNKYRRTVAVGDIHGDFKKLRNVLRHAKLIDKKDNWIATDTILVQL
eukprot:jgi/Orpsp1_1/1191568/evm.model.d7180000087054.1